MPLTRIPSVRTLWRAALVLALGSALAGCVSDGQGPVASQSTPSGATVAFESIDGPPPQVFDRMVNILDSEAQLRNVAVVSRKTTSASYRVRSYLAAQTVRGRTSIDWVWDVYDRDQQRALRLSGEEPASKAGRDVVRDPWSAADDLVLRKIAQAGLSGLSSMINGTPADTPSPAPAAPAGKRGPAIANAEEPSAAGANIVALGYTEH
jgi:hypothetical protein